MAYSETERALASHKERRKPTPFNKAVEPAYTTARNANLFTSRVPAEQENFECHPASLGLEHDVEDAQNLEKQYRFHVSLRQAAISSPDNRPGKRRLKNPSPRELNRVPQPSHR